MVRPFRFAFKDKRTRCQVALGRSESKPVGGAARASAGTIGVWKQPPASDFGSFANSLTVSGCYMAPTLEHRVANGLEEKSHAEAQRRKEVSERE